MKIIYDSDNKSENSEDEFYGKIQSEEVEITFTSEGKPKAAERPKPHLSQPRKIASEQSYGSQTVQPQQPAEPAAVRNPVTVDANGAPVYGVPMPITPEQWGMMMAQFAAMQQAGMFMQPQQPMPGQMPYEGFVPYTPAQPIFEANGQNPQTKVLYQSADFDSQESTPKKSYEPPKPVFTEELQIEEEVVPLKRGKSKAHFSVDENEMTMFEFDAMAKKMNVPEYRKEESEEPVEDLSEEAEEEKKKKEKHQIVLREQDLMLA